MEGLFQQIDAYCERTDFSYWSEPVNAVTNAAFLFAAALVWHRLRGQHLPLARGLCVVLVVIGIGSYLFHTHATVWAAIADTAPIGVFVLIYIFAANRDYWQMRQPWAIVATLAFFPYAAITVPMFRALPFFEVSAGYWAIPLLIALYSVALWRREPATARGLAMGAAILSVSLTFRSLDAPLCGSLPIGTHFLWHILNAMMLGWMIEVYRRHMSRHVPK